MGISRQDVSGKSRGISGISRDISGNSGVAWGSLWIPRGILRIPRGVSEKQKKSLSASFAKNSVAAVCARVVLSMSSKLSCNCAVVGEPGVWKVTTLRNKKTCRDVQPTGTARPFSLSDRQLRLQASDYQRQAGAANLGAACWW